MLAAWAWDGHPSAGQGLEVDLPAQSGVHRLDGLGRVVVAPEAALVDDT